MSDQSQNQSGRIRVLCQSCGKEYRLPNKAIGRKAKCVCGYVFTIPSLKVDTSASFIAEKRRPPETDQITKPVENRFRIQRIALFAGTITFFIIATIIQTSKTMSQGRSTGNYNFGPIPIDQDSIFNTPSAAVIGICITNLAIFTTLIFSYREWNKHRVNTQQLCFLEPPKTHMKEESHTQTTTISEKCPDCGAMISYSDTAQGPQAKCENCSHVWCLACFTAQQKKDRTRSRRTAAVLHIIILNWMMLALFVLGAIEFLKYRDSYIWFLNPYNPYKYHLRSAMDYWRGVVLLLILTEGFLLAWIWRIHRNLKLFTAGRYPYTPGKAVGFLCIPCYGLFWFVRIFSQIEKSVHDRVGRNRPLSFYAMLLVVGLLLANVALSTILYDSPKLQQLRIWVAIMIPFLLGVTVLLTVLLISTRRDLTLLHSFMSDSYFSAQTEGKTEIPKPKAVRIIACLRLLSGVLTISLSYLLMLMLLRAAFVVWPFFILFGTMGICEIVSALNLVRSKPRGITEPTVIPKLEICSGIFGNVPQVLVGIISLLLLRKTEVRAYLSQFGSKAWANVPNIGRLGFGSAFSAFISPFIIIFLLSSVISVLYISSLIAKKESLVTTEAPPKVNEHVFSAENKSYNLRQHSSDVDRLNMSQTKLDETHLIWEAVTHGNNSKLESLIARGANVNAKDDGGVTPLHLAVLYKHPDTVKLLISKGADVNAKDIAFDTPLKYALKDNLEDIADILRKHGAKE